MEEGAIPPNLHFNSPNPAIPALTEGRMQVVTKLTKWSGGYMAINSSGFGGSNVHALLESNMSEPLKNHPAAEAKRLLTHCGRTEEAVRSLLETVKKEHPANVELHALLQETAGSPLIAHPYRGCTVLNDGTDVIEIKVNQ